MRRSVALAAALCLAAALPAGASERREIDRSLPWSPGQRIEIDFPIGSLEIGSVDGSTVEIEIEARCKRRRSRCAERLEAIALHDRSNERRLRIEIDTDGILKDSGLELDVVVRVPRAARLEIEMSVGELEVRGVEGDLRVDLGVGEVRVYALEKKTGSVRLDAGIGEARLFGEDGPARQRRSMLVGSEVDWDGSTGRAAIDVEVGIGEVRVYLD